MSNKKRVYRYLPQCVYLFIILALVMPSFVIAQTSQEQQIRSQISERNAAIEALEQEIQKYQNQLSAVQSEKQTLQRAVEEIEVTQRKLQSEIALTQEEIERKNLEISELTSHISDKDQGISQNKLALQESIQRLHELENTPLLSQLLNNEDISDIWRYIGNLQSFQQQIRTHSAELHNLKENLVEDKSAVEQAREELVLLREELEQQKEVIDNKKEERAQLLSQTKNKESNYRQLLADKRARKKEFEQDLHEYQSRLEFILDPDSLPSPGTVVLDWPLDYVYITQRFGLTPYSERLYGYRSGSFSGKHTGIDFRASGDRVQTMASGTVIGVGNTDTTCPGASFGKWVLIKHDNGLASIYSHLSTTSVTAGTQISRGTTIGYSGNTGYSTAPHLDVKVVPRDAVSVETWPSKGCPGAYYTTPIVRDSAYLNPLSYLPSTSSDMFKPGA